MNCGLDFGDFGATHFIRAQVLGMGISVKVTTIHPDSDLKDYAMCSMVGSKRENSIHIFRKHIMDCHRIAGKRQPNRITPWLTTIRKRPCTTLSLRCFVFVLTPNWDLGCRVGSVLEGWREVRLRGCRSTTRETSCTTLRPTLLCVRVDSKLGPGMSSR